MMMFEEGRRRRVCVRVREREREVIDEDLFAVDSGLS